MNWGSVADWFTAVGTIGACLIALILARRQTRPLVSVYASVWGYAASDSEPAKMRGVDVTITNRGYQPFAVQLVLVTVGITRAHAIDIRGDSAPDVQTLSHGESVRFSYPIVDLHQRIQEVLARRPFGWFERRLLKCVRIGVYLSTGEMRTHDITMNVRHYLLKSDLPADVGALSGSRREPVYRRVGQTDATQTVEVEPRRP